MLDRLSYSCHFQLEVAKGLVEAQPMGGSSSFWDELEPELSGGTASSARHLRWVACGSSSHSDQLIWMTLMKMLSNQNMKFSMQEGYKRKKKSWKVWEYFKLIQMECTVDEVQECKAVYNYYQTRLTWQKGIGIAHLNRPYLKCTAKYGLVGKHKYCNLVLLLVLVLLHLAYVCIQRKKTRKWMVKLVVSVELSLSILDNNHSTTFVKEYLQPRHAGIIRNTFHSIFH